MAFQSIQEAEQRLQNPHPLTEQEVIDLMPWMQMLGIGSHARLQAHLGIGNVRAIQALNETSGKIEGAVRRMDDSSTRLGIAGLLLNGALFFLTVIGIWIALKSYKAAEESSVQQQQTLDASRRSLESASQALNRLTTLSEQQLKQWEEYQKQALAKPDFAIDFSFLFSQAAKTVRKYPLQSIFEYKVPYGRDFVFLSIVKNITHTPAHNVRIFFGIGTNDKIENITVVPPEVMREVPSTVPGWRLFERDEAVFYPGEWQLQVIARIKADTPDGFAQMAVSVEGSDLMHRYQQWVVFRKAP